MSRPSRLNDPVIQIVYLQSGGPKSESPRIRIEEPDQTDSAAVLVIQGTNDTAPGLDLLAGAEYEIGFGLVATSPYLDLLHSPFSIECPAQSLSVTGRQFLEKPGVSLSSGVICVVLAEVSVKPVQAGAGQFEPAWREQEPSFEATDQFRNSSNEVVTIRQNLFEDVAGTNRFTEGLL